VGTVTFDSAAYERRARRLSYEQLVQALTREAEIRHQRETALDTMADSVERDRREPDKLLCHVQTARRETR